MVNRQQFFDREYTQAKSEGFSAEESFCIANKLMSNYRPVHSITGKKSMIASTPFGEISTDNVIRNVVFGGIKAGHEEKAGGRKLDKSGWTKSYESLSGDMNHYKYDTLNGVHNNLEEEYIGLEHKASNLHFDGENLVGDITLPDSETASKVKQLYYDGKIGVSPEYTGNQEEGSTLVTDWEITGYTLHTDPDFDTKL